MILERSLTERAAARTWTRVLRALLALGVVALCAASLRQLDWVGLGRAARETSVPLVAAAAAVNMLQVLLKSERWRLLLSPFARLGSARLYGYLLASFGASMVLPGPASEVLRIYLLKKRHGISVAPGAAVVSVEKLFEGIGLVFIVAPLPLFLVLPRSIALLTTALSTGGAIVAITAVILARRASPGAWKGRWSRLAAAAPAIECLRSPRIFAGASALSFAAHATDCLAISLVLAAVGLDMPWATGGLVALALTFALIVPLTPGHFGALEAGAAGALTLLGAPLEKAVTFALAYHLMQLLPMVLFGLLGLGLLAEAREEEARDTAV